MDRLVCIRDFHDAARSILDKDTFDYYKSGADDEITLRDNREAFGRWIIRPRMLRDVSVRSLSTTVLGKPVEFPLGVSPTAMQKMSHPDGEIANAKAAASMGTIFTLATISTSSIEEVAAACPKSRKWFQLYVYKDRNATVDLIRRAEAAGFEAIVFTVDSSIFGKRRTYCRSQLKLPRHLRLANFQAGTDASDGASTGGSAFSDYVYKNLDQSLTWEAVSWLKKTTRLPIILKGILTKEDARLAVHHGANGIFVSNHGGRQLDTVSATVDILSEIIQEVNGQCECYVDGGISTGSDIFKVLALGAKMAFAGRPFIWGMSVGGEEGVKKVLQIYKDELDLTMSLAGVQDIDKITRDFVAQRSNL